MEFWKFTKFTLANLAYHGFRPNLFEAVVWGTSFKWRTFSNLDQDTDSLVSFTKMKSFDQ